MSDRESEPFYLYSWDLVDAEYSSVRPISATEYEQLKSIDHDAKSPDKEQRKLLDAIYERPDADLRPSELDAAIAAERVITQYG